MEDMNGTGKIIGALLAGALAGVAIGVLFAPEKGSFLRNNILGGSKNLAEELKNKWKEEVDELRKKADELEKKAKEKTDDLLNSIKNKAEEATKTK